MFSGSKCGSMEINAAVMICCNGLVYVKSGVQPACCGSVGYDHHHYYCCAHKTIMRRDRYKLPRCCGESGYDALHDVCVDGYVNKRTDLGSNCCMTDRGWKCCAKTGTCCSEVGSGQVDIPGFRPACCDIKATSEKAACCANTAETTGFVPSCCSNQPLRPKCCKRFDGSSECCSGLNGYCCIGRDNYYGNTDTTQSNAIRTYYPEVFSSPPTLTESPYNEVYPVATPSYNQVTSSQHCCTKTRRTCCTNHLYRNVQPCCFSIYKPTCCYTSHRIQHSCCARNVHSHLHRNTLNLQTARVNRRGNWRYRPNTPVYNRNNQESCCNALSISTCCREKFTRTGRQFQCCQSSGNHNSNQALHSKHYRESMNPQDLTPYEEIMTHYYKQKTPTYDRRDDTYHQHRTTPSQLQPDIISYEYMKCNGEPFDLAIYICCDGVLRYRIGVEPRCCSTEAYDASIYKCCNGIIRRYCDSYSLK